MAQYKGGVSLMSKNIKELLSFIDSSPTAFHAVSNIAKLLDKEGFRSFPSLSPGI